MKRPLNFAILKYMTTVDKACPADVVKDLQKDYPGDRRLNETAALESLMTATENGLLVEDSYEVDGSGNLVFYYAAPDECKEEINKYIK
ncbi:MAG TPA: hypothetical protein H9669_08635 [Firmicutes bacterium]|nr:hypothetical protein [Bacillota bacterium]